MEPATPEFVEISERVAIPVRGKLGPDEEKAIKNAVKAGIDPAVLAADSLF